eukprot:UN13358
MGCGCASSINNRHIEVYNISNGDQITILTKCIQGADDDMNLCQHDVNIKLFEECNYNNFRLNGAEIYRWFESRNSGIPQHFLQYEDMLDQFLLESNGKKEKCELSSDTLDSLHIYDIVKRV